MVHSPSSRLALTPVKMKLGLPPLNKLGLNSELSLKQCGCLERCNRKHKPLSDLQCIVPAAFGAFVSVAGCLCSQRLAWFEQKRC